MSFIGIFWTCALSSGERIRRCCLETAKSICMRCKQGSGLLRPFRLGSQDFCVRAEGSIQEIYKELQKKKAPLELEMGIVKRIGALGEMQSVYLRDPDGNLVEICVYSA